MTQHDSSQREGGKRAWLEGFLADMARARKSALASHSVVQAGGDEPGNQTHPAIERSGQMTTSNTEAAEATNEATEAEGTEQEAQESAEQAAEREARGRIEKLAQQATKRMDKDFVRPAQFEKYEPLLAEGEPIREILDEANFQDLERGCKRNPPFPRELSDRLRNAMNDVQPAMTPSHIWVKGIAATYLELLDEQGLLEEKAAQAERSEQEASESSDDEAEAGESTDE